MKFFYNDGGRSKYYKSEKVGDCVCRAIAIANEMDYKEVYDLINEYAKKERINKKSGSRSSSRNGVAKTTTRKILNDLGWKWIPTMSIGSGCKVHLKEEELPKGTIILALSKHLTCVKDGVIHDTYDCSRDGNRCVYGYYIKAN